ncbi:Uncharacterized protein DBV15_09894, partial [Temnothorax longispinosus]
PSRTSEISLERRQERESGGTSAPRTETRREKSFRPFLRGAAVVRNEPPCRRCRGGCAKGKSPPSPPRYKPPCVGSPYRSISSRALGGFGAGFHTAQRPNYP